MSESKITKELERIVRELMYKEGITNYKWRIEGQTSAGENYMGDIIFFKILSENGDTIHDLVMKAANVSQDLRGSLPLKLAYDRELALYTRIFPEFQKFLKDVKANFELDFVPKIYWSTSDANRESLVLSNLKSDGYKLKDRKITWNLEHSLFVMEHYAKFHAISLAFKDQRPRLFEDMTKNMTSIRNEFSKMAGPVEFYGKSFEKIMKLLKESGRDDLIIKYDRFMEKTIPIINEKIDKNDKIVITHGDGWNNNFMFKYMDDNETAPHKMCFLDFQLASLGTPIIDLSYNIFTTCDKSSLQHLDLILETYYNTLSATVRGLGSSPDVLFSRENFENHWKKYSRIGVLLSTIVIKILLTPPEEAPDVTKLAEEGNPMAHTLNVDLKNEVEYNKRILDVFTFYGDRIL